jgi:hypothetical protein
MYYLEGGKVILVIPHTEKLSKIQLRDSIRWKVSIPARASFFNRKVRTEELSLIEGLPDEPSLEGTIENISTGELGFVLKGSFPQRKAIVCF